MRDLVFQYPKLLYLLLLLIPAILWYVFRDRYSKASLQFSSLEAFKNSRISVRQYLRHLLFVFRIVAFAILIIVLARPQSTEHWQNVTTEGIDIMIALDISSSMLARDFQPDRLEASKDVATEFISGRPNDRIGLVVFAGESFTQCPLTSDHSVLINFFHNVESGMIEDGTAIGNGLATSISRLKDSKAISKVIILLTDGVSNRGEIAPKTAAEIAKTFGIRVYTVGVGSMGMAPYPVNTPFGIKYQNIKVEIDEEVLKEVALATDGRYFRATNNKKLKEIYEQIDQLEKSKIEVKEVSRRKEEFAGFALIAFFLLVAEGLFRILIFRTLPI
ncbi:MAG: VWA domain-containing protein [Bacteroidota bacterium]|nr:VWA domain-containing protein [Bacteroidota bacterium]